MLSWLWLPALVLIVVGLIGVVVPILPGAFLVFSGLFLGAWADDFTRVGVPTLLVLGALTLLTYGIDFAASAFGAGRVGASRRAVIGAGLGTLVGLFFGLPGIILGPFLGAVLGEYTVRRKLGEASKAGAGAWLGLAIGAAAKAALLFLMLGLFAAAYMF